MILAMRVLCGAFLATPEGTAEANLRALAARRGAERTEGWTRAARD